MPKKVSRVKGSRKINRRKVTVVVSEPNAKPRKIKGAPKRSRSAYLAMVSNPLVAKSASCPDAFHAESIPFALEHGQLRLNSDNTGSCCSLIDPFAIGGSTGPLTMHGAGATATDISGEYYQPCPLQYSQITNEDWNSLGAAGRTFFVTPDFVWLTNDTPSGATQYSGTTQGPKYFPQNTTGGATLASGFFSTSLRAVYDRVRPLCAGLNFQYIGPHGDGQKGIIYVNTSMIGTPANGASHFGTLAELKSHPKTVMMRVGADFVVNMYPADTVSRAFVPLNNIMPAVASWSKAAWQSGAVSSGGAATASFDRVVFTSYPSITAAGGVYDPVEVTGPSNVAVLCGSAVSSEIPLASTESITAGNWTLTGQAPAVGKAATAIAAENASCMGQWPLMYVAIEASTASSSLYAISVKSHFEAIPNPRLAELFPIAEHPVSAAEVKEGDTIASYLGDLGSRLYGTLSSFTRPYMDEFAEEAIDFAGRAAGAAVQTGAMKLRSAVFNRWGGGRALKNH